MIARTAYDVIVPPELAVAWRALPHRELQLLNERLLRAAQSAWSRPVAWPKGIAGIHRGRHRAIVEDLWVLYRLNDEAQTVSVIGFGHVSGARPAPAS